MMRAGIMMTDRTEYRRGRGSAATEAGRGQSEPRIPGPELEKEIEKEAGPEAEAKDPGLSLWTSDMSNGYHSRARRTGLEADAGPRGRVLEPCYLIVIQSKREKATHVTEASTGPQPGNALQREAHLNTTTVTGVSCRGA